MASAPSEDTPDLERRFGGLRRLYGHAAYERLRALRIAVVGLGGVGSWAVEALARSGVAELVLIDMDHVAESNINRQIQATGATLGMAKGQALAQRVADIHPGCTVHVVDEFVDAANWPGLLPGPVDALIDACDQVRAKATMAAWALQEHVPLVCCGAAGGKRHAERLDIADLAAVTHDPLLASLRQRLRREHGATKAGQGAIGVRCVFSRENVAPPADAACDTGAGEAGDGSLNCHGYGSAVTVTASFGFAAAGETLALCLAQQASFQSRKSHDMI
jgi:tRNA threonylcarbamoyladenosine dehydratase